MSLISAFEFDHTPRILRTATPCCDCAHLHQTNHCNVGLARGVLENKIYIPQDSPSPLSQEQTREQQPNPTSPLLAFSPTELHPSQSMSYTPNEILQKFKNYISGQKCGLKRFYYDSDGSDEYLRDCAKRGSDMTKKLVGSGCPPEVASELSLLALWDLVVLIGTSRLHMFVLVLCTCCLLLYSH